jgi:uncharacterized membrane protein (DUF485 family)
MTDMTDRDSPQSIDPTPTSGSATDVAPLGRAIKPPHELTADEDVDVADWPSVATSDEFKELLRAKAKFVIPATIFFIVYYFTLPILVGYAPRLMERKVIGPVNLAYLFALSQFFMAWLIAALYMRRASHFDRMVATILESLRKKKGGG